MKKNIYVLNGEKYLKECVIRGLAHSYDVLLKKYNKPYPEVTGYIIKYFCDYSDELPSNIIKAGKKLVNLQDKKTGGFPSFDKNYYLYSFDTSQILIGLSALYMRTLNEKYRKAAINAGEFLLRMQLANGAITPIYNKSNSEIIIDKKTYSIWNGPWSGLMCKLTEGFQALYELTNDRKYLLAKEKTAEFYLNADYIECSHPLGYWLEGLYSGEKYNKVDEILKEKVIPRIKENGFISYREDLEYAYTSGIIQLGIILFKRGFKQEAEKIRDFGRLVQSKNQTGGIFQYCDKDGNLDNNVHTEINSWGTKYYCELEMLLDEA